MKKFMLGMLLAACAAPAVAQAPLPDANPALWVVKDQDTTIYLFGTFHMLDGKRDWFNDEVKTAFDASQEVVLEAKMPENPAELKPLVAKYAVDPTGRKLSDKLTPALKAKYEKGMASIGIPAQAFEPLEPWFATMTLGAIGTQKLGLKPEHGPETIITAAAKQSGKPVGELEGFEQQFKIFDTMPEAEQIVFFEQTLDGFSKMGETLTPMLNAWSSGDTDKLVKIMNESIADNPRLYDALFTSRNSKWADWIQARMGKPGTVFMAVGAGHLAGKDSVQAILAQRGIKSARVPR